MTRLYCDCVQSVSLCGPASGSPQGETCQLSNTRKAPGAEREDVVVYIFVILLILRFHSCACSLQTGQYSLNLMGERNIETVFGKFAFTRFTPKLNGAAATKLNCFHVLVFLCCVA